MPEPFEPIFSGNRPRAGACAAFGVGLLAIVFALAPTAFAQYSPYRVDHWTTDNGLPQNTVRSIVQTRDGYLWLTTFDGLARFDGVRFTVFDKSNTPAITNNRITALHEDHDGTLWIGTEQGEIVAYHNGVFTAYPTAERLRGNSIVNFSRDLNDEMLVLTNPEAYYIRAGELIAAPSEYSNKKLKLYRGQSGSQWTLDRRGVRQVKDGQVIHYPITFDWNGDVSDMQVYEDRQSYLWVGDESSVYRLGEGQTTRYDERAGAPSGSILRPQCEDNDGNLWFATGWSNIPTIGLVRFQDERFTVYGNAAGLPAIAYNELLKDREGSIWVATSSGLYRLRRGLVTTYSTDNGLPHNEVYPLLKARNGDIWIGTIDGISLFRNGAVIKHPLNRLKAIVQALWEDAAGRIWIGMYGGLCRYENGKFQSFPVGGTVNDVKSDSEGNYWVASERGLFKLNDDKLVARYTTRDGLPGDDVKIIVCNL